MTEREFWQFLEKSWEKGRAAQMTGVVDSSDPEMQAAAKYIEKHSLLPADYQNIPEGIITAMSGLLFSEKVRRRTKEAVLMILAHQQSKRVLATLEKYSKDPDRRLKVLSQLALNECEMWNT